MALKLEAGKYYRTRDGRKVGPVRYYDQGRDFFDLHDDNSKEGANWLWKDNGEGLGNFDLIAEWQDDAPAPDDAMTALKNAAIAFICAGNYSAALEVVTILRDEA